ncbi:(2Fe-2S) ferredoxin domain-containing protein [Sporosalibacterium faouarense]|uniref:(2Fe-2S) ferredoxin domain-containing protein n=1 Tax=Sporosalibacterium faouarense TaxID=516123 RepID=UPI00141C03AC|nr:(2Fe-2S) ferredoxin domain-containing protein [Sporosalibacterium faouarense]MTI49808.1 (2Fe-2S) ferredoxin domain-containing protein [Bacillota bacterium]
MKSIEELRKVKEESLKRINLRKDREEGTRIVVSMDTCGIAAGARSILMSLLDEVNKRDLKDVTVTQTGCIGACNLEPVFEVYKPGEEKVTYVHMTLEKAKQVMEEHIINGKIVQEYTIGSNQ